MTQHDLTIFYLEAIIFQQTRPSDASLSPSNPFCGSSTPSSRCRTEGEHCRIVMLPVAPAAHISRMNHF